MFLNSGDNLSYEFFTMINVRLKANHYNRVSNLTLPHICL